MNLTLNVKKKWFDMEVSGEKKEEQLREAADKMFLKYYDDGTGNVLPFISKHEEKIKQMVQEFSKQYHYSNDSVDQAFKRGYYEANEDFKKQQESDAVLFVEWIRKNNWEYSVSNRIDCWFKNMSKYTTTQELYQLFKSNNNGNND